MPLRVEIRPDEKLVVMEFEGVMNTVEFLASQRALPSDPRYRPDFDSLVDLSGVERMDLATGEVFEIGDNTPSLPASRLALVASSDVAFGMSRAYVVAMERRGRLTACSGAGPRPRLG